MRSIIRILLQTFTIILGIMLIISIFFLYNSKNDKISYFGKYTSFITTGESMAPFLNGGELIILKKCDSYDKNDVITFDNDENRNVTHRIIDIQDGEYQTKGDNNNFIDGYLVPIEKIYGKMVYKIDDVGKLINYINKNLKEIGICFGGAVVILIILSIRKKNV